MFPFTGRYVPDDPSGGLARLLCATPQQEVNTRPPKARALSGSAIDSLLAYGDQQASHGKGRTVTEFVSAGTVGSSDVRRHHIRLVLALIRDADGISRADLVARTGLTKPTVTSLVSDLDKRGIVRETRTRETASRGRPARLLELNAEHAVTLVVEVNIDRVVVSTFDFRGDLLSEDVERFDESPRPEEVVRISVSAAAELRAAKRTVAGIAVAVPAMIDAGVVRSGPHLGWDEVRLADMLHAAEPIGATPVVVDRLVNFSATSEHSSRGGLAGDVVVVYGDVGLGSAHLVDGEIVRGAQGLAGEAGHTLLDPDGPLHECGRRGCAAALIGLGPLVRDLGLGEGRVGAAGMTAPDLLTKIGELAVDPAPSVREVLDRQGRWLGRLASTLLHLMNPSELLLGGHFTTLAPLYWDAFDDELRQRALPQHLRSCRIRVSATGAESVRRGAHRVVADDYLARV